MHAVRMTVSLIMKQCFNLRVHDLTYNSSAFVNQGDSNHFSSQENSVLERFYPGLPEPLLHIFRSIIAICSSIEIKSDWFGGIYFKLSPH